MKKSTPASRQLRPQARPERTQLRPQARPDNLAAGAAVARGNRAAQREAETDGALVRKKAAGGTVRGMGAAKKGGKFTRSA
jgi:hypothetical protein